jgi:hypothetical protein
MLIKVNSKFGIPEIFFGMMLAVAIFVLGVMFESSQTPNASNNSQHAANNNSSKLTPDYVPEKITDWLLVILNAFLVGSTFLLWRANNRSARIAERTLAGLERPRILSFTPDFGLINDKIRAQIGIMNFGRDPGRLTTISVKFFTDEKLPSVPDFNNAETRKPDIWMLPATGYDQPMRARVGFLFEGDKNAKFMIARILYEWDFGKHEHAFATTVMVRRPGGSEWPESAGGAAYNYDK